MPILRRPARASPLGDLWPEIGRWVRYRGWQTIRIGIVLPRSVQARQQNTGERGLSRLDGRQLVVGDAEVVVRHLVRLVPGPAADYRRVFAVERLLRQEVVAEQVRMDVHIET